jgi:phage baseplate assembly protein W
MTDQGRIFGRGISFPPRIDADGRMVWSEGETNVRESIRVILMTEPRERLNLTDFGGGLGTFLFEPNTAATHQSIQERIEQSLGQWEPRIRVETVAVESQSEDGEAAIATITYRLVATQLRERVAVKVAVGGRS